MWRTVIIDDDPNLLEGMRYAIPWHEFDMEWVGEGMDGKQGLKLITRMNPDIVICDIDMPIMNGLEMIEHLRRNNYLGKIIILSGYSDFEYARKALRLAVQDYLSKPIAIDSLKQVLSRITHELKQEHHDQMELEKTETERRLTVDYTMNEWLKMLCLDDSNEQIMGLDLIQKKIGQWSSRAHLVIALEFGNLEEWVARHYSDDGLQTLVGKLREIIQRTLTVMDGEYDFVAINSHQYAILLHLDSGTADEKHRDRVRSTASAIQSRVRNLLQLKMSIGLGNVRRDWRSIYESFEAAFRELAQGAAQTTDSPSQGQLRSIRFYHQIAHAIRNSHEGRIMSLIGEHMDNMGQSRYIPVKEVSHFKEELLAIISYTLYDIGVERNEMQIPQLPKPDQDLFYSRMNVQDWLTEVVRSIMDLMNVNDNPRHRKIVEMIKSHTDKHYMEDLTLGYMAEQVQVSKNYLGQIFKSIVGETYNSYLTRVRMEKAKEMLMEGNLYIYEVAEKVGYNSISYFSTQFKKYTGQNPTNLN